MHFRSSERLKDKNKIIPSRNIEEKMKKIKEKGDKRKNGQHLRTSKTSIISLRRSLAPQRNFTTRSQRGIVKTGQVNCNN